MHTRTHTHTVVAAEPIFILCFFIHYAWIFIKNKKQTPSICTVEFMCVYELNEFELGILLAANLLKVPQFY